MDEARWQLREDPEAITGLYIHGKNEKPQNKDNHGNNPYPPNG